MMPAQFGAAVTTEPGNAFFWCTPPLPLRPVPVTEGHSTPPPRLPQLTCESTDRHRGAARTTIGPSVPKTAFFAPAEPGSEGTVRDRCGSRARARQERGGVWGRGATVGGGGDELPEPQHALEDPAELLPVRGGEQELRLLPTGGGGARPGGRGGPCPTLGGTEPAPPPPQPSCLNAANSTRPATGSGNHSMPTSRAASTRFRGGGPLRAAMPTERGAMP